MSAIKEKLDLKLAEINVLRNKIKKLRRQQFYPYRQIEEGPEWDHNVAINELLDPLIDEYNKLLEAYKVRYYCCFFSF